MYRQVDTLLAIGVGMAIFHLHAQVLSRAAGQSAVAAAAYRHCAAMTNETYGRSYDFSNKRGNVHSELALPANAPQWAQELAAFPTVQASEAFWNRVEAFETRKDSQLAREMTLGLPVELTREQNIAVVREFVDENFSMKGIVADWAYHDIKGNPHVHIMTALRPLTEEGFGAKNNRALDENGEPKFSKNGHALYRQFAGDKELIPALREAWADVQNHHLAAHGFDVRVDHRSYREQGIEIEPTMHRGPTAEGMDRRGAKSDRIEINDEIEARRRQQVMNDPSIILKLITAEKSVFDERDVARVVHRYTDSYEDFQALYFRVGTLENQVMISPPIFDPMTNKMLERPKYTTTEVLDTERNMITSARALVARGDFSVDGQQATKVIGEVEKEAGFSFDPEQRMGISRLTESLSVAVMVGYAGAGKSTVMNAVRAVYEAEGRRVVGGALAGKAAVGLQTSAGIESRTLASWEASWKNGLRQLEAGDVFVLDEAGMVGSAQMQRFVTAVERAGAKLILLGDARQLQPIEAGAAFRAIASDAGYIELTGVRRQREEWMQHATIEFGRGESAAALSRYIDHDLVLLENDNETARGTLIGNWRQDWEAGVDVLMLAHRNADVLALNMAARSVIKQEGGLQDEHAFRTARGPRQFAVGDRIVFLEKSRGLDVENGSFGTVEEASRGRLVVGLSDGRSVIVAQNDYANIDYGYAATIHKSQGATVDRVHVLASRTMDAHMAYVAMSRHRETATLYAGADEFASIDKLVSTLSRERMKDTTLAYEHTDDYQQSVREFAERRGFPSLSEIGEMFRQQLAALRGRFNHAVERLEALGAKFAHTIRPERRMEDAASQAPAQQPRPEQKHAVPAIVLPELTTAVRQALSRLEHNLNHAEMADTDRARRRWFTNLTFEMQDGSTASDLQRFNREIAAIVPQATIVSMGPDINADSRDRAQSLIPEPVRQAFIENWPLIHAGQKAAHDLIRLEAARLLATDAKERLVIDQYERKQAMLATPEKPLIAAVTEWRESVEAAVAARMEFRPAMQAAMRRLETAVAAVWQQPEAMLSTMRTRIDLEHIPVPQFAQAIREDPASLGDLNGSRNFFGRNDSAREKAIAAVPLAVSALQDYGQVRATLRNDLTRDEQRFRTLMQEPVNDLSPAARALVGRIEQTPADRLASLVRTADDSQALAELRSLVATVRERFGAAGSHELDRDWLAQAMPGADQQRIEAFAAGFKRAEQIVASVQAAQQAHRIQMGHEQQHNLGRGRDQDISH
ncbi:MULTISPECIES: Ti-type conjugative transfer relaxase TraA [unclassified Mesorhizobium]|uniref:Ti-type conjugative transfer relaxase TraA n=1 Tax=unclassified Mesorhizobium TaxID=325217 RepID=UPI000FD5A87A|nr:MULTISPECIES: Ti-type conjugative transfer relaxase TraA [unclassified Mesorhizobium]RUV04210.1 Ti-type conjugative transfer relaxase TraA [Mesorhizobium sp. M1A.F.Ca.IN.020.03.2.1]RWG87103.1 MAG: Ti-type conjugative transfer relaxase TraA [Mesorhizobium sp.]RWK18259.1 MAG: Ti-type conjugative transfer relaxase TraA [Mesorhizobium sp.]